MVRVTVAFIVSALACAVAAAPHQKRIAQVISDSTKKWEAACDAAGGADKCNTIAVNSFGTLLAAAAPCDQQDVADNMIDLAKTLNNDPDMIKFAQIFAQQPRNTPTSQSVQYCQQAPKNAELNGLFQCQFQGANPTTFVGGVQVGAAGTIPFGMTTPLSPPGSCPANPSGPIADGTQLSDLVDSPGTPAAAGGDNSAPAPVVATTSVDAPAASATPADDGSNSDDGDDSDDETATISLAAPTATVVATPATSVAAAPAATSAAAGGDFHLQNGEDAQALNAKFATLSASSTCNEGDQACVAGAFAQCVGGTFVSTQCAGGTQCFALPLVNKAGTSIACTTQSDALARIQATGAQGGITGN